MLRIIDSELYDQINLKKLQSIAPTNHCKCPKLKFQNQPLRNSLSPSSVIFSPNPIIFRNQSATPANNLFLLCFVFPHLFQKINRHHTQRETDNNCWSNWHPLARSLCHKYTNTTIKQNATTESQPKADWSFTSLPLSFSSIVSIPTIFCHSSQRTIFPSNCHPVSFALCFAVAPIVAPSVITVFF